jgi:hypothetical protein
MIVVALIVVAVVLVLLLFAGYVGAGPWTAPLDDDLLQRVSSRHFVKVTAVSRCLCARRPGAALAVKHMRKKLNLLHYLASDKTFDGSIHT